jgi:hypothetical protein
MLRPGWAGTAPKDITFVYGNPGDTPLVGDWDGNGSETPGVWRAGSWFLKNSLSGGFADVSFRYGDPIDVPLVGDWTGNGITRPGVFRNGTFLLRNSNTTGVADVVFTFGEAGDIPVAGDWDGDGVDTVGVYRPSISTFYLSNRNVSNHPPDVVLPLGDLGDRPVIGDWDGDGVTSVGVKRGGDWFLKNDSNDPDRPVVGDILEHYGTAGDVAIVGDWDPKASRGYSVAPASLQHFFPLAADFQSPKNFDKWKKRGINTIIRVPHRESAESWTQEANRLGLKMIRKPRPNPAGDAHEPNLLASAIEDEPDGDPKNGLSNMRTRYNNLKTLERRMGFDLPVFFNLIGGLIFGQNDRCDGVGDSSPNTSCYPSFLAVDDWLSQDFYPANDAGGRLDLIGRITDKLTKASPSSPTSRPATTA